MVLMYGSRRGRRRPEPSGPGQISDHHHSMPMNGPMIRMDLHLLLRVRLCPPWLLPQESLRSHRFVALCHHAVLLPAAPSLHCGFKDIVHKHNAHFVSKIMARD